MFKTARTVESILVDSMLEAVAKRVSNSEVTNKEIVMKKVEIYMRGWSKGFCMRYQIDTGSANEEDVVALLEEVANIVEEELNVDYESNTIDLEINNEGVNEKDTDLEDGKVKNPENAKILEIIEAGGREIINGNEVHSECTESVTTADKSKAEDGKRDIRYGSGKRFKIELIQKSSGSSKEDIQTYSQLWMQKFLNNRRYDSNNSTENNSHSWDSSTQIGSSPGDEPCLCFGTQKIINPNCLAHVSTGLDHVSTGSDHVGTGSDHVSTGSDSVSTDSDNVSTDSDNVSTDSGYVNNGKDADNQQGHPDVSTCQHKITYQGQLFQENEVSSGQQEAIAGLDNAARKRRETAGLDGTYWTELNSQAESDVSKSPRKKSPKVCRLCDDVAFGETSAGKNKAKRGKKDGFSDENGEADERFRKKLKFTSQA